MKIKAEKQQEWNKFLETNSKDSYSRGAVRFMMRWANLMEIELEEGKKLTKKSVESLSDDADTEGITGAMYELSKGYLGYFWEHGEELKNLLGKKVVIKGS